MPRFGYEATDSALHREELIRQIEHELQRMTTAELESLHYDLSTKLLSCNRDDD